MHSNPIESWMSPTLPCRTRTTKTLQNIFDFGTDVAAVDLTKIHKLRGGYHPEDEVIYGLNISFVNIHYYYFQYSLDILIF